MDRNTLTGLVLIFVIIAASVFLLKPSDEEIKKERERQAARNNPEQVIDQQPLDSTMVSTETLELDSAALAAPFGSTTVGEEKLITLENELLIAQISSKGGRVKSVELKN